MLGALFILGSIAGTYALWALFIFVYTSRLTQIKRSTWHWKIYNFVQKSIPEVHGEPTNSCEYRKGFYFLPIALLLWMFVCFCVVLLAFVKIPFDWLVMPIVVGKVPSSTSVRDYFDDFLDGVSYRTVTSDAHLMYTSLVISLSVFLFEVYRIVGGKSGFLELSIFVGLLVANLTILTVRRSSVKALWKTLRERMCVKISVVD